MATQQQCQKIFHHTNNYKSHLKVHTKNVNKRKRTKKQKSIPKCEKCKKNSQESPVLLDTLKTHVLSK